MIRLFQFLPYFWGKLNKAMSHKVINVDKEILGGTPVFWGTRVPIKNLFDYLEEGETVEEFLQDFPSVTLEQVERVLLLQSYSFQKEANL